MENITFAFQNGEVVLAEWRDKLYYAKILHINHAKHVCTLLFDDDSIEYCAFTKIHSVTETTAEIVCIMCKDGSSCSPNEIVLCDKCGLGYHQKCHEPAIKDTALEPDAPWMCVYCSNDNECPYLLNPFETKMQKDLRKMSVRKRSVGAKDRDLATYNFSKSSKLMANFHRDTHQLMIDVSRGSHVPRETHQVMNMRDRLGKNEKYSDEETKHEFSNFRKKRIPSVNEKHKTLKDVWDNSGYISNDATGYDVDGVDRVKRPREKHRLTQELQKQRKKLREDTARGKKLQNEHKLLSHDQSDDILRRNIPPKHEHYNGRQNYGKMEELDRLSEKNTHTSAKQKLDPCECNDTRSAEIMNGKIYKMPDIQCDHSNARRNKANDYAGNKIDLVRLEERLHENCSRNHTKDDSYHEPKNSDDKDEMLEGNNDVNVAKERKFADGKEVAKNKRGSRLSKAREKHEETNGYTQNKIDGDVCVDATKKENSLKDEKLPPTKLNDVEYWSDSTEDRVRSDLPRHNWLLERWMQPRSRDQVPEEKNSHEGSSSPAYEQSFQDEVLDEGDNVRDDRKVDKNDEEMHGKSLSKKYENRCSRQISSSLDDSTLTNKSQGKYDEPSDNIPIDVIVTNEISNDEKHSNCTSLTSENTVSPKSLQKTFSVEEQSKITRETSSDESRIAISSYAQNKEASPLHDQLPSLNQVNCLPIVESRVPSSTPDKIPPSMTDRIPSLSPDKVPSSKTDRVSPPVTNNSPLSMTDGVQPSVTGRVQPSVECGARLSPSTTTSLPTTNNIISKRVMIHSENESKDRSPTLKTMAERTSIGTMRYIKDTYGEHVTTTEYLKDNCGQYVTTSEYENYAKQDMKKRDQIIVMRSEKNENIPDEKSIVSKIQTGKSVNPVSPIIRADKYVIDDQCKPHALHLKPLRYHDELSSKKSFVDEAYPAGFHPKTFTPHLLTHNSVDKNRQGHGIFVDGLPSRVEISHSKTDADCPFHGKTPEKPYTRFPTYPITHADVPMYPNHPFYQRRRYKDLDKLSEHMELLSDPVVMQRRRLSNVYNRHHLPIPHKMSIHQPRHLPTGFIEERSFPVESYRYQMEATRAYARLPQSHVHGACSMNRSADSGLLHEANRHRALKFSEDMAEKPKEYETIQGNSRFKHLEHSPHISKKYHSSDSQLLCIDHVSRVTSPGRKSPTFNHKNKPRTGYIQLDSAGPPRPHVPRATLDHDSINRDFNERFSMLDKNFKEKLEGPDRFLNEDMAAYRRYGGVKVDDVTKNVREKTKDLDQCKQSEKLSYPLPEEKGKQSECYSPGGVVTRAHISKTGALPYYFTSNIEPNHPYGFSQAIGHNSDIGVWQRMTGYSRTPGYPIDRHGIKNAQDEKCRKACTPEVESDHKEKINLAIEEHRRNMTYLENERRRMMMAASTHERKIESERRHSMTNEEMRHHLKQDNRKRKLSGNENSYFPKVQREYEMNKGNTYHINNYHLKDATSFHRSEPLNYSWQRDSLGTYMNRCQSSGRLGYNIGNQTEIPEVLRQRHGYNEREEEKRQIAVHQQNNDLESGEPTKKKTKKHFMCDVCKKEASFLCSGCQKAWYCSAKCQHTAWGEHRGECTDSRRR